MYNDSNNKTLFQATQPIDKNIQIQFGKIYTIDSKISVISVKNQKSD